MVLSLYLRGFSQNQIGLSMAVSKEAQTETFSEENVILHALN